MTVPVGYAHAWLMVCYVGRYDGETAWNPQGCALQVLMPPQGINGRFISHFMIKCYTVWHVVRYRKITFCSSYFQFVFSMLAICIIVALNLATSPLLIGQYGIPFRWGIPRYSQNASNSPDTNWGALSLLIVTGTPCVTNMVFRHLIMPFVLVSLMHTTSGHLE